MGAERDSETVEAQTVAEVEVKFEEIREQRAYDFGHAGYTGSFAEKSEGVTILPVPNKLAFWTIDALEEQADDLGKWGPAIAGKIDAEHYYIVGYCSS